MVWGERHGQAKLKLEDIARIRALKGTMFQREIADKFGVSRGAIKNILNGKTWVGLKGAA
jgi:transcriptional regulator with XRE-family HTH domain